MALTPEGTPYVESTDLVANYPAASLSLANRVDLVGVLPFATSAARATAIPSPTDGQYSYLQDTNSTQFWNGSAWVASGGKILQVVQATTNTPVSTTSTSFVTTGLSASITPVSASNNVLILAYTGAALNNATNHAIFTMFRGTVAGTNLGNGSNGMINAYISSGFPYLGVTINHLDSPNTTSAQTYTMAMRSNGSATTTTAQNLDAKASIILMEVSA